MLKTKDIENMKKVLKEQEVTLADVFKLLGDKNRFFIVKLLMNQEQMCVSDLANVLDISSSAVSQHLRILEMSKVVECERMGQMMCYRLKTTDPSIRKVINLI